MDIQTFYALLSPTGQNAIQSAEHLAPKEIDFLRHLQSLSREYPTPLARAALEIAILRLEAAEKYPFADRLYLTREALEQASNWEIATYRAKRYRTFKNVIDLGCSIGSDTWALGEYAPATGIDLDPLRLAMANANARALSLQHPVTFLQANLAAALPLAPDPSVAAFFDPARRSGHRRIYSVREYKPPLKTLLEWLPNHPALGAKISPAVNLVELTPYNAELEFISLRGDLKECVLWFGSLKTTWRRATLLPGGHSMSSDRTEIEKQLPQTLSKPLAFIYEPDPAILRAGLVQQLGEQLTACQLDRDIAYLTASEYQSTPFARAWEVIDWFPFHLKRLRAYLREHKVGQVIIKKRGSPLQPEKLIQQLQLEGMGEVTIFLTHRDGTPIVIVCEPAPLIWT